MLVYLNDAFPVGCPDILTDAQCIFSLSGTCRIIKGKTTAMNAYSTFLFTCALSSIIILITCINHKGSLDNETSILEFSIFELSIILCRLLVNCPLKNDFKE